jgi:hypothetical protein
MMTKPVVLGVVLFAVGIFVGRASVLMTQPEAGAKPQAAALAPSTPMPAGHPAPTAAAPQGAGTLHGTIAEVIQVASYTYLRLESGEWAAVPSAPELAVGSHVEVSLQTEMVNFSSPSLGRVFPKIWFGALGHGGQPHADLPAAAPAPAMVPVVQAAMPSANEPALTLRVTDVFSEKAMLSGKKVKVKGTVDRSMLVQGLHYVHLKDGTGSAADKTDDLLCLSTTEVQKGAQVTMEGVVTLNKDVGMGPLPVVLDAAQAK